MRQKFQNNIPSFVASKTFSCTLTLCSDPDTVDTSTTSTEALSVHTSSGRFLTGTFIHTSCDDNLIVQIHRRYLPQVLCVGKRTHPELEIGTTRSYDA